MGDGHGAISGAERLGERDIDGTILTRAQRCSRRYWFPLKSPEIEMCEMVQVACPVFGHSYSHRRAALAYDCVRKMFETFGLRVTAGAALTPVPESGTICGLLLALSAIVTLLRFGSGERSA